MLNAAQAEGVRLATSGYSLRSSARRDLAPLFDDVVEPIRGLLAFEAFANGQRE